MREVINEKVVMKFYLDEIENDEIPCIAYGYIF